MKLNADGTRPADLEPRPELRPLLPPSIPDPMAYYFMNEGSGIYLGETMSGDAQAGEVVHYVPHQQLSLIHISEPTCVAYHSGGWCSIFGRDVHLTPNSQGVRSDKEGGFIPWGPNVYPQENANGIARVARHPSRRPRASRCYECGPFCVHTASCVRVPSAA